MIGWLKRLHSWTGRKLYGASWPPCLIVILRPKDDALEAEPKVFH